MKTSLSDDPKYSEFSRWCLENRDNLSDFRRDSVYSSVVPSYPIKENGDYYYNILTEKYSHLLEWKKFFEKMDFGNPRMFEYEGIGVVDPVVLRMILVCAKIDEYIGLQDGMSICEIGPGNGILFKVITDLFPMVRYTFVDLPSDMFFLEKNVEYYGRDKNVEMYLTCDQVLSSTYEERAFDLVISECAFNECYIDAQRAYMDKIINMSRKGRIVCNDEMFYEKPEESMNFDTICNQIKSKNKIITDCREGMVIMWGE